jgi:SAM-dependent methyltransferase
MAAKARPQQIDFAEFDIAPGDIVVDVGCGGGDVCVYAAERGASVIGIDIEPELIARTTQAMNAIGAHAFRGIVSDANPIPLPDGTATVVVATEVMEHVPDPARFLGELARIARPGARILLSVPHPSSEAIMKLIAPDWYWQPPLHINVFEPEDLDRLFAEAGLAIDARHPSGFYWSMWWFCRMAIGMEHKFADTPDHPIFRHWNATMAELVNTSSGHLILEELNRRVPKSQVVIAHKPVVAGVAAASSFGGPSWARKRVARMLRDGAVKVGAYQLQWKVRRSR